MCETVFSPHGSDLRQGKTLVVLDSCTVALSGTRVQMSEPFCFKPSVFYIDGSLSPCGNQRPIISCHKTVWSPRPQLVRWYILPVAPFESGLCPHAGIPRDPQGEIGHIQYSRGQHTDEPRHRSCLMYQCKRGTCIQRPTLRWLIRKSPYK